MEERLQKLMSAAGLCSRRTAEQWIQAGRVQVNGRTAVIGDRADLCSDTVTVDGQPLTARQSTVWVMLHKPCGVVSTLSDDRGRPTVADLVSGVGTRVFPVGRLDCMSEGLLLLTNDGTLAQKLLHPRYGTEKVYRLMVYGTNAARRLSAVRDLDGEPLQPVQIETVQCTKQTADLLLTLREGKNRQIRRMCQQAGLIVKRLIRVQEHTLSLGTLPSGQWRYLTAKELAALQALECRS